METRLGSTTTLKSRLFVLLTVAIGLISNVDWGFYGHKVINEQAVYALPYPLRSIFISHTQYLKEHAVDADKRRYAIKTEAYQHYFDFESWGKMIQLDRRPDRRMMIADLSSVYHTRAGDTIWLLTGDIDSSFLAAVPKYFTGGEWDQHGITYIDTMSTHGLLPLTIINRYHRLVAAFKKKNLPLVLKYAADLGHYIGDAHVPLHTSVNYNGQFTGQLGIHAFWETSIPELLVADEFDLVVGRAEYVESVHDYAWEIVESSHSLVDQVLLSEKEVRAEIHDRKELCPINRNGVTHFSHCPEFTRAYHERMGGMVEVQMRSAIKAIADLWWTAYVEAGQPRFDRKLNGQNYSSVDSISDKQIRSKNRCE